MISERCGSCPDNSPIAGVRRLMGTVRQDQAEQVVGCPGPRVIETLQKKVFSSVPVVIHRRETCGQEPLSKQLRVDEKPETAEVITQIGGREVVQVMAKFFFARPMGRY